MRPFDSIFAVFFVLFASTGAEAAIMHASTRATASGVDSDSGETAAASSISRHIDIALIHEAAAAISSERSLGVYASAFGVSGSAIGEAFWTETMTIRHTSGGRLPTYFDFVFHLDGSALSRLENYGVQVFPSPAGDASLRLDLRYGSTSNIAGALAVTSNATPSGIIESFTTQFLTFSGDTHPGAVNGKMTVSVPVHSDTLSYIYSMKATAFAYSANSEVAFLNTLSLEAILLPDGQTPESQGYSLTFDSGLLSPNLVAAVPEPGSLAIWGLSALGCAMSAFRRKMLMQAHEPGLVESG